MKVVLINQGYFPKELPPLFTTEYLSILLQQEPGGFTNHSKRYSRCIRHNSPKIKQFTRTISIPNPLHQVQLSSVIAANWDECNRYFDVSRISLSRPVEDSTNRRAIKSQYDYDQVAREKFLRSFSARYVATVDISRFYPTIYTHSIPWALHGKSTAKLNRSITLWGNSLDTALRNTQDQQTLGIPIGPDTSRIISEIVAVAIDIEFQEKFGDITGIRYIDDYYFFTDQRSQAERILSEMAVILKQFELELNEDKTDILEMPQPFNSTSLLRRSAFV